MKKLLPIFALVLIAVFGGYYFMLQAKSSSSDPLVPTQDSTTLGEETGASGPAPASESAESTEKTVGKEMKVIATSFAFAPKEIKVKKGDTVTINLVNNDGMHDWVVDEFNARTKVLKAGESETITFVADKAGTFEYYCSVGKHRQMGMVGNLIVEE